MLKKIFSSKKSFSENIFSLMQIKTNSSDDSKIYISKHNFFKQVPDIHNHMRLLNPFKLIKGKNSGEHTTHIYAITYFP